MIRALITDLDGTLFFGHGETVFDLTKRNTDALERLRNAGICLYGATGRFVSWPVDLLRRYGFADIRAEGFNGAVGYDNGRTVWEYTVSRKNIIRAMSFLDERYPSYIYAQVQTTDFQRVFSRTDKRSLEHYRKQSEHMHMDHVCSIDLQKYDEEGEWKAGKLSVRFETAEEAQKAAAGLKNILGKESYVTMSDRDLVDVTHPEGNKGRLPQYLIRECGFAKEEIAVIGDGINDLDMFPYAGIGFAMENGEAEMKKHADRIVRDVAECIDYILKNGER